LGVEVGEHHGDGLSYDPAAVDRHAELATQRQTGLLEVDELLGGAVDRDLLLVPLAPGRPAAGRGGPTTTQRPSGGWGPVVVLGGAVRVTVTGSDRPTRRGRRGLPTADRRGLGS